MAIEKLPTDDPKEISDAREELGRLVKLFQPNTEVGTERWHLLYAMLQLESEMKGRIAGFKAMSDTQIYIYSRFILDRVNT